MKVMIGIDPHKGSHTAVVIDPDEEVIDEIRVKATANQVGELREWASGYEDRCWAVESARGLGYLLSQQLVASGERVLDVPAMMASRVRVLDSVKSQKNDPNDARSVAIAALRHPGLVMVVADDHTRVLGLLAKRHRDVACLKNKAACRLHALLGELTAGGLASEMTVNKANSLLENVKVTDEVTRQRIVIATELVDDIARFEAQMRASKKRIRSAVAASGTSLCEFGESARSEPPSSSVRWVTSLGSRLLGISLPTTPLLPLTPPRGTTSGIGSTRGGTANSTTPYTSPRSPNSDIPARAVTTTRRNWPKARPAKKRSEHWKRRISDVVYRRLRADARQTIS
jgi:hypothetical protein